MQIVLRIDWYYNTTLSELFVTVTVGVKMEAGWLIVGLAGGDDMFGSLLLSVSLSRTRFGSSGGETAGGGGCWRCPNTEGEDQALRLQQPAGLWVPLLLPSGYHVGQYSQVSMKIQTQICLEAHMHYDPNNESWLD